MAEQKAISLSLKSAGIILLLSIAGGVFIYLRAKKAGSLAPLPLPDSGAGIPAGWTATADAIKIRNAVEGFGTNEENIFSVLDDKTRDQLIAIKNEYGHRFNEDMIQRFNDELSGDDLSRALNYYKGII